MSKGKDNVVFPSRFGGAPGQPESRLALDPVEKAGALEALESLRGWIEDDQVKCLSLVALMVDDDPSVLAVEYGGWVDPLRLMGLLKYQSDNISLILAAGLEEVEE